MDNTAEPTPTPKVGVSGGYWIIAALILAAVLMRLGPVVARQLGVPFDLAYESPNLATIEAIRAGRNVYDPGLYEAPPFILTIYTPLYHYLVAALPWPEHHPFFTGRVVALGFMLLAAAMPLLVDVKRPGQFLGLIALSLFLFLWPVTSNAAFLKTDSLALYLSASAVVTAAYGPASVGRVAGAAVLCTLAVASKQSYVGAVVACSVYFFANRRSSGLLFLACFAAFAGTAAGCGYLAWGDGFPFSVAGAVRQPLAWAQFRRVTGQMCRQPLFVVVFGACVVGLVTAASRPGRFRASPYGFYALASWGVLLASLGKLGSSTNYFFEPCLASLLFAVSSLKVTGVPFRHRPLGWAAGGLLAGLVVVDLLVARPEDYSFVRDSAAVESRLQTIAARNRAIGPVGPDARVLNLAGATLTGDLPGEVSVNDPYLYLLVWQNGQLSEEALVRCLNRRYYDVVVVTPDFGTNSLWDLAGEERLRRVVVAVRENYPVTRQGPDVVVRLPKDGPEDVPPPVRRPPPAASGKSAGPGR